MRRRRRRRAGEKKGNRSQIKTGREQESKDQNWRAGEGQRWGRGGGASAREEQWLEFCLTYWVIGALYAQAHCDPQL